jgi:hypothetical protein
MNKEILHQRPHAPRRLLTVVLAVAMSMLLSGCYFTTAVRDYQNGSKTPWWCEGAPDLIQNECILFSLQLDTVAKHAYQYPTLADFTAAGASHFFGAAPVGAGEAYVLPTANYNSFNVNQPQALLYDGTSPTSQLLGVLWVMNQAAAPEGFPGPRDVWVSTGASQWVLPAWIIRGYQHHPYVFNAAHPCLAVGVTLNSTADACCLAAHTEPFEIVVANDDGVLAPGIDALVEGLYDNLPVGTVIHVVAPALNQSGSGDDTTPEERLQRYAEIQSVSA